jgi:hypothetical protein
MQNKILAVLLMVFVLTAHPAIEAKTHSVKPDQTQTATSKKQEEVPKNCIRKPRPKEKTWMRKTGQWIEGLFGNSKSENLKESAK